MAKNFIYTRHEWMDVLASKSSVIAKLDLKRLTSNDVYKIKGQKICDNKDAFNFANSDEHNGMIARLVEYLASRGASKELIQKLIVDLTSRNTYGSFCELAAYEFLRKGNHDFEVQVPLGGADILNPNGADLDGLIKLPERLLFDIKAFGFNEHLVTLLTERLSDDLKPGTVTAEDSWDIPVALLFDLLGKDYKTLLDELRAHNQARRAAVRFVLRPPARMRVTTRVDSSERLADQNPDYAFRYAKQFARNEPFFLFFVIHPWFSGISKHHNFGGATDRFTKRFACGTFQNYLNDTHPIFDLTMGAVSKLLTGIVFINAWEGDPPAPLPRYRCFLNKFAINRLPSSAITNLAAPYGSLIEVLDC